MISAVSVLLMMVCNSIIHQLLQFHVSNENTMKWWIMVNNTTHFTYSTTPILLPDTWSVMRSIFCTKLFSRMGRRNATATHAAMCMPNEVLHISIINPTPNPMSSSAQRGVCGGRFSRKRIYTMGNPHIEICRWSNSSTCSAMMTMNRPISLIHSIV